MSKILIPEISYPCLLLKVLIDKRCHNLMSCFVWDDTPQGHNYWGDRATELTVLSQPDQVYLWLCYYVSAATEKPTPFQVEVSPAVMSLLEFHTSPEMYALYEASSESPEIDRVLENIRRHRANGLYDRAKALHSIGRYVVEPAAIKVNTSGRRWWETYPVEKRQVVADMILRGWERELGI